MKQTGVAALAEPGSPCASEPGSGEGPDTPKRGSKSLTGHGTTNAALKLLDDLCMMATGK